MSYNTLSGPHHSGGASGVLQAVAAQIREQVAAYCDSSRVPGCVAGVYHDDAQTVAAYGLANVVTGAPMREDTGFLVWIHHESLDRDAGLAAGGARHHRSC